jgi:Mce-associated membrane protein
MSDVTRGGRGGRRRIAGQRRTTDRPLPDEAGTVDEAGTTAQAVVDDVIAGREPATDGPVAEESAAEEPAAEVEEPAAGGSSYEVEPEEGAAGSPRTVRLLIGLLAVVVVLTLATAVFLGQKALQDRKAEQARSQATAAAQKAAELVLSYDYRELDKDFAAARATLTPEFAKDFDVTAKVVGEQATKTRATVRAEVREVGVKDANADRVTLLVFVNQTTTSTITQGKPRVDLNRARFTMVRSGSAWRVQQIEGL